MTHLPQKNVNLMQFEKRIVHVNHASYPRLSDFEGRKPRKLFFLSRSQTHSETSELRNSLKCPWKFPEIFANSQLIFGNSDTLQDKNLTPLAQKELAGIHRCVV